jgi:hypothetical protein
MAASSILRGFNFVFNCRYSWLWAVIDCARRSFNSWEVALVTGHVFCTAIRRDWLFLVIRIGNLNAFYQN